MGIFLGKTEPPDAANEWFLGEAARVPTAFAEN